MNHPCPQRVLPLTLVLLLLGAYAAVPASALNIITYDAGLAGSGPANLDPVLQGWTATGINTTSTDPAVRSANFLTPDGATGYNAVQITDQNAGNPTYSYTLTASDLQAMYTNGWELEARVRSVDRTNYISLGVALGSDPGWGLTERERILIDFTRATNGDQQILSTGYSRVTINPGANSSNDYHLIRAVGVAGSTQYELFIDGVSQGAASWTAGTSNAAADNLLQLTSGSSAGTGRVANFNYVSLTTPDTPPVLHLLVDRDTGVVLIVNDSAQSISNVIGYSIDSAAGAISPTSWTKFASASPLASDNDDWTTLSSTAASVAEAVLITDGAADGGNLATGAAVSLGALWKQTPFEDLQLQLLLDDGSTLTPAIVYTGNGGSPFQTGDFDADGDLDASDWLAFKSNYGDDYTGLTQVNAYLGGDVNGDGVSTFDDFIAFRTTYDSANGANAFAAMIAAVPEPTSLGLLAMGCVAMVGGRRVRRRVSASPVAKATPVLAIALVLAAAQAEAVTTIGSYDASIGSPTTAAQVQSPEAQGWTEWASGRQGQDPTIAIQEGAYVSGTPAWLNSDPGETNPGYYVDLDNAQQRRMWAYGWRQEVVISLVEGSHLLAFGVDANNPWGVADLSRIGVSFGASGGNMVITPTVGSGGSAVTAGPLNGDFARVVLTGSPMSSAMQFQVFDFDSGVQIGATQSPTGFATGNATNANIFGIQSGSGTGVGRSALIHQMSLEAFTPDLVARVNEVTGEVTLTDSTSTVAFGFAGYSLTSEAGSLSAAGWNSLQDQNVGGNGAPNDGLGFEELRGAASEIAEGNLIGSVPGNGSLSYSLGALFNGGTKDLKLTFTDAFGTPLQGIVEYFTPAGLPGDFNLDGFVSAADYTVWRDNLGASESTGILNGNGNGGVVDQTDYTLWRTNYGRHAASSSGSAAVPEPSAGVLALGLLAGAIGWVRRRTSVVAKHLPTAVAAAVVASAAAPTASAGVTVDRLYLFGDDAGENGAPGAPMGVNFGGGPLSFDSDVLDFSSPLVDAQDLSVMNGATYVAVDGTDGSGIPARPGAAAGDVGAKLDGASSYLTTISLNEPDTYWNSTDIQQWVTPSETYPRNYSNLFNRGIDFWVYPSSANNNGQQHSVVRDSIEHGVVITENGTWGNAFDNTVRDSGVAVQFNQWNHVQVVTTSGRTGSVLYVNGVAVEANRAVYDAGRDTPLVIGANLTEDGEFFTGAIDDMRIFVWGNNETGAPGNPSDGENYGAFNLATDNAVIAKNLANLGVTNLGDVNLDGAVSIADVTAFQQHYGYRQLVTGTIAGDWVSRQNGDLNYDGRTDLADAFLLHQGLNGAGFSVSLATILSAAVPEPSSAFLVTAALAGLALRRRAH